ncbi:M14 family metallopeptidase [Povalibacter sp.]|uniref:M14 family metallopeptidase n=1 Tax=Povalibacter sp. TaxID=1962978 RepID=UPI002F3E2576
MMATRYSLAAIALAVLSLTAQGAAPARIDLTTVAEKSGFKRTGRLDEVARLCESFQERWPSQVRGFEFGRSPEGRPLLALAASADGTLDAASARGKQRPVALMQGGIHSGEIDGKDAGFLALRELLEGRAAPGALERVTLVFVPVFSVDGHERFGRWNRPNQVGPEEMGWRVTAQNLNLNRDYTKADAPEMQAMLRLLNEWDPLLYVDLHVTDGAEFEHDVSYNIAPTLAGDPDLTRSAIVLRDELIRKMTALGSLPLNFYPSFVREDDPQSGFEDGVGPAWFSQQYWALSNRIGVLVETHSWKDYPTRVRITRNSIVTMLELLATHGAEWQRAAQAADQRASQLGGTRVPIAYANTDHVRTIEFRGYEYTREPSAISGALVTRYDNKRPQIWRVPLKDQVAPSISVTAPRGGYIVPAAHAKWLGEKLALHGVAFATLTNATTGADVETFRAVTTKLAATTFEGRTTMKADGDWKKERRDIPAGSLFVPIAQPKAYLAMTLLEPKDSDSYVSWGFFNTAFERKEYMEDYVAEAVGAEMLKKDPAVKQEFERKLADDPAFAASPAARLDFFYQRSPSWDERFNLYPVYRTELIVDSGKLIAK